MYVNVGIDIGSTTVKIVVVRDGEIIHKHYERHFSKVREKAVELVRLGKADFLMKGLVDTNIFLKAILNKETGLPVHGLLSHVMTFDTLGAYHKLMITSDGGMVLYPTLEQKLSLIHI